MYIYTPNITNHIQSPPLLHKSLLPQVSEQSLITNDIGLQCLHRHHHKHRQ